jgi:succinate dehydrogenase hydrophobic anchor subunit
MNILRPFFQRITAAFLLPLILIYKKVSSTFLLNLSLFWHINEGIEEIMADYVHQEITRNFLLVYLRLFLLIVTKDVFLSLVSFPNKSKNLMDRTHPWLLRNISALRCGRNVLFCFELEARALSSIKVWNPDERLTHLKASPLPLKAHREDVVPLFQPIYWVSWPWWEYSFNGV